MRTRRYPSDLTGAQWALVAPHIPPAKSGGRPRTSGVRAVLDAIIYLLRTGCQWRQLPCDFPPWPTVYGYFRGWRMAGVWVLLHRALYPLARMAAGRKPEPTLVIMDGQSVKTSERGGVRGFDGNAVSWLTFSDFRSPTVSNPRTFPIGELAAGCWQALRRSGRAFAPLSLMRGTRVASSPVSFDAMDGACTSSSTSSERSRSQVSPGSLNAASLGSASIVASRKTMSAMSRHQRHCWTSLQFA